ncbi:MAG: phosphotransferase family protein [Acidimicrobiales bacterium]
MSDAVRGVNVPNVTSWFADHLEEVTPPLRFEQIVGGRSNLTYRVTDAAGRDFVLRRPPLGHVLATAHDMAREHKIIAGVGRTGVPVPAALGCCEDVEVNDAPFYVMGFAPGEVIDFAEKADALMPDHAARRRLGLHAAEVLADLHLVDPDQVGLGDLGRREGYLDRQLSRWAKQWEASKTREAPAMEEAHRLLLAAQPEQRFTGIVHGDFRIGNFMSDPAAGRVTAVLDWELCALGDTLADLGYLLNDWHQPGEEIPGGREPSASGAGGFPTREELVRAYCARSGRDLGDDDVAYYRAFQNWRLAVIVEGVRRRYLEGVMGEDTIDLDLYARRVEAMAAEAVAMLSAG